MIGASAFTSTAAGFAAGAGTGAEAGWIAATSIVPVTGFSATFGATAALVR